MDPEVSIIIPYPGTPLFRECRENGCFVTEDWDRYDMREPVMKCPMTDQEIKGLTQELYKVFLSPEYVIRRLLSIRNLHDLRFIGKGVKAVTGHLTDFSNKDKCMRLLSQTEARPAARLRKFYQKKGI